MSASERSGFGAWIGRRREAVLEFLSLRMWSPELRGLPTFHKLAYQTSRVVFLTVRGFRRDNCLLRAGSLTFITGLSIVPLLAFAFSVAKGLGAYDSLLNDSIRPFLDEVLGPGDQAEGASVQVRESVDRVLDFVQRTDLASLGTFGLGVLLYTVVKLLGSIEASMNHIWGVHRPRTLLRKVSDYLSIVVIVPILLTTATAATAAIQSDGWTKYVTDGLHLEGLAGLYARAGSLVVTWVGFTFLYLFLPNTRVHVRSALLGGLIGGSLWQIAQVAHVRFQVGVANYNAIYSTFAALPIFMFWLYLSWITMLLGAEVACAHQSEPAYRQVAIARSHDHAFLETLALRAMLRVAIAFRKGEPPFALERLGSDLGVPERSLQQVLDKLSSAGLVALAEEDARKELTILPARDLALIRLQDVLDALTEKSAPWQVPQEGTDDRILGESLRAFESARAGSAENVSLEALARRALGS